MMNMCLFTSLSDNCKLALNFIGLEGYELDSFIRSTQRYVRTIPGFIKCVVT